MNKIIPFLLICLISLSGCTIPFLDDQTPRQIQPLIITLESDLTTLKSGEKTFLYLTFDNLDELEEYEVSGKIMDGGIFIISDSFGDEELKGLQKKTLEMELGAPEISADIPSRISVEVQVLKISNFHIPILFTDREYAIEQEIAGQPIQEQPKIYTLADRLVNVEIELNKNPPIDTGNAWATIKLIPRMNGILDFDSIYGDDIMCEEINEFTNTVSCEFSGDPDQLEEINFDMEIEYTYREIKYLNFMILKGEGEYIPTDPTTDTSRVGDDAEFNFDSSVEKIYPTTSQITLTFEVENNNKVPLTIKDIDYNYPTYFEQYMINNNCEGIVGSGETKECRLGLTIRTHQDAGTTAEVSATITYTTTLEYELSTGNSIGDKKVYTKWSPFVIESEVIDVSYDYEYCTHIVDGVEEIDKCPNGNECSSGCECRRGICERKTDVDQMSVEVTIRNNGNEATAPKNLKFDGTTCTGNIPAGGEITCGPYIKDPREKIQMSMEYQSSTTLKKEIEFSE